MSLAIYVRVSTQRQAHAQTIEQQLERLRTHIRNQGWELTWEHIFRDDGYSGASLNRPGLDRLRDAVRAAEVDRVLITDPDRLARNDVRQMVLLEELERWGCQVLFLDRPMSQDPHDHLLLQIRGAVAEYERTLIAERMRRGRQMKLRAGSLLPWTRPPYGYWVDPDHPVIRRACGWNRRKRRWSRTGLPTTTNPRLACSRWRCMCSPWVCSPQGVGRAGTRRRCVAC